MAYLMGGFSSGYLGILTQFSLKLKFIVTRRAFGGYKDQKNRGTEYLKKYPVPLKRRRGE